MAWVILAAVGVPLWLCALQHRHPGPDRAPNRLPAPLGPLSVTMTLCARRPEVVGGRSAPPPIRAA